MKGKLMEHYARQGEVLILKLADDAKLPNWPALAMEGGNLIVGHSETGHHHVLVAERAQVFEAEKAPEGMRVLYALLESPGELKHLRGFDTHAPQTFEPGAYMFRTDREYDPYAELARRVAD